VLSMHYHMKNAHPLDRFRCEKCGCGGFGSQKEFGEHLRGHEQERVVMERQRKDEDVVQEGKKSEVEVAVDGIRRNDEKNEEKYEKIEKIIEGHDDDDGEAANDGRDDDDTGQFGHDFDDSFDRFSDDGQGNVDDYGEFEDFFRLKQLEPA
jgi:hypothetical protein